MAAPARILNIGPSDPYMRMDEVAGALHCSVSTAYERVRRADIPHKRQGSRYLIHRAEFERWASGQQLGESAADLGQLVKALESLVGRVRIRVTFEIEPEGR